MIKLKNSVFKLVENVKINITYVKAESDRILRAKHIPRVILEFWKDTKSQHQRKFLNECFNFIFYCASDWRSFLTTLIANNIGLLNTSNLIGGYNKWLELSDPIEEAR